ncbi:MAG: LL-diaminopimelate aminotransferase [Clostridia bacterium]
MKINSYYGDLKSSYLFPMINKAVNEYKEANPTADVIKMGIGDVTLPLAPVVIKAITDATAEMGKAETFKGYGDEQGYGFLREAIANYYAKKNVELELTEIFISDGAKSDVGNILDIFAKDNIILIPDPVYPVYVDTNIMAGRKIVYMNGNADNNFLPLPCDDVDCDVIYLCSPNNPTGAVYTKEQLKAWVDYANKKDAIILFDSAYEIFVTDDSLPTSIFEIEGAKTCAIEFCSLSKTAGFTGTRCGYTVVPNALIRENSSINKLWLRRQTTKFNGVPYIVQKGAEAVFTDEGMKQIKDNIDYYRVNAKVMADTLTEMGIWFIGGENSPYIWLKCPEGMGSWDFFHKLLNEANIVGTPGAGFGENGEGFFRLTAFGTHENTVEAMRRLKELKF